MKTITVSEFRKNIRKYAELASEEKVLVNRGEGKSFLIVPIENIDDKGYNPEFVKRILASKDEASKGKVTKVNNINDIWADIL
jgi:PHD/YefM family antitoxin component YafN of YafNO toxin-antitoxin module